MYPVVGTHNGWFITYLTPDQASEANMTVHFRRGTAQSDETGFTRAMFFRLSPSPNAFDAERMCGPSGKLADAVEHFAKEILYSQLDIVANTYHVISTMIAKLPAPYAIVNGEIVRLLPNLPGLVVLDSGTIKADAAARYTAQQLADLSAPQLGLVQDYGPYWDANLPCGIALADVVAIDLPTFDINDTSDTDDSILLVMGSPLKDTWSCFHLLKAFRGHIIGGENQIAIGVATSPGDMIYLYFKTAGKPGVAFCRPFVFQTALLSPEELSKFRLLGPQCPRFFREDPSFFPS